MKLHIFTRKLTALIMAVAMAFLFASCGGHKITVSDSVKVISAEKPSPSLHTQDKAALKSIIKSGLYELLLDEKNCSVAVKDSAGTYWYALPETENAEGAMLSLRVSDGKTTYVLNSQDNAVAFGNAETKKTDNGVELRYTLSEKKDKPQFKIPVTLEIVLKDGLMSVSVNCEKIVSGVSGFVVTDLSVMPSFGATAEKNTGDFILVPDGSGALINLEKSKDANYRIETYGSDPAVKSSSEHFSIIPAFGFHRGNGAFAAVVTNGDAISEICAATKEKGLSGVYANFNLAPASEKLIAERPYDGSVSVSYKFVSGSSVSYGGIAAVCKEQLIRSGKLSTRSVSTEGELPLNVTLIGCLNRTIGATSEYTGFRNAYDIITLLKSKGVDAISLRYDGALSDGIRQKALAKAGLSSKLGGKKAYEELQNYMNTQGFKMFLNLNMTTSASGGSKAGSVSGGKVEVSVPNLFKGYVTSAETFDYTGLAYSKLSESVVSFMNRMKEHNVSGYCLDDVGSVLFSDMSGKYVDRQKYADEIFSQAIAISTNRDLMVENGNLYVLKNAGIISQIPMDTTYEESEAYEGVPFVQMILHGTVEYTGPYLNLSENMDKTMLHLIDYGALPAFCWTNSDYTPKDVEKSALYYDNWTSKSLDVYESFNSVFSDLRNARMTDRRKLQEGLYRTEYNNETYVYVNYTDSDISYNNMTIKAGSYLRVN